MSLSPALSLGYVSLVQGRVAPVAPRPIRVSGSPQPISMVAESRSAAPLPLVPSSASGASGTAAQRRGTGHTLLVWVIAQPGSLSGNCSRYLSWARLFAISYRFRTLADVCIAALGQPVQCAIPRTPMPVAGKGGASLTTCSRLVSFTCPVFGVHILIL